MTNIEAIRQVLAQANYSPDEDLELYVRRILCGEDIDAVFKDLSYFEDAVQKEYDLLLLVTRG